MGAGDVPRCCFRSSPITTVEVFYSLAVLSHRQDDDEKAIQMLERALNDDKECGPARDPLVKIEK